MIATISLQSHQTGMQNHHHLLSLTANTAGDPLPLIPRRPQTHHIHSPWPLPISPRPNPSVSASSSLSTSCGGNEPTTILASASIVTITPATPPKTESDSDNSPMRRGKRRKRDLRIPNPTALYPPELSTPMPSPSSPRLSLTPISKNSVRVNENPATRAPIRYTPGMPLRLSIESLRGVSAVGLSLHSVQSLRPSPSASESLSSSSSLSSVSTGCSQASPSNVPLIRKKSGQVVRPSLKSSSSYSSSVFTSPNLSFPSSKSEPATPFSVTTPTTSKAVHFDKNLERVKLFLTQQKPLAVSREGSPGDTDEGETSASGTESNEIDRFFGSSGDPNRRSNLVDSPRCPFGSVARCPTKLLMHTNLPFRSLSLSSSSADATLESLILAKGDKSIQGSVLVRNIAYDKSVTARFSFDGWCTTSEVNGKWKESVGATRQGRAEWDRFEFRIWLGDLKLGEEMGDSRKLELAVRYRVASRGYELWDNNGGRNYTATFERPGILEEKVRGRKSRLKKKSPSVPFSDDELSDLLEKVATSKTTRKARSISPTVTLPSSASASFPTKPCKPPAIHTRTRSFPFSSSSLPQSVEPAFGWMEKSPPSPPSPPVPAWLLAKKGMFDRKTPTMMSPNKTPPTTSVTLGSPRDLVDDTLHHIKFPIIIGNDTEGSTDDSRSEGQKTQRHQQGGYFDSEQLNNQESTISGKRVHCPSEPTTPTPSPSSRFHSFPPLCLTFHGPREDRQPLVESPVDDLLTDALQAISIPNQPSASFVGQTLPSVIEANLPQSSDDTSDYSSTSTLLESPSSSRSSTPPSEDDIGLLINQTNDSDDHELYREFLNRFCFFTGHGSPPSNSVLDEVKKNESSSESSTPTLTPSGSIQTPLPLPIPIKSSF